MEKSNNTTTAGYKYLIRLHNLPRNSSLSHILRFLWEAVNFNADEACIRAYSSKNAIVGFTKKNLADESVSYCNGRVLYGRLISVHEASDEDLQRVLAESKEAGPELGPKRLGPARGVSTEEEDNGTSQGYDYEDISTLETGLNSYSDSDSDMDLAIPDFHKNPPPPDMDTTASRHRHSSGSTGLNEQMSTSSSAATTDEHSPQQEDNVVEVESAVKTTNLKRKAGAEVLAEAGNEADGKRPKKLARTQKQDSTEYRSPLLNIPLPPEKRPRLDQPATSAAVAAVTPASPLQLPPSTFRPPAPGDPRWPSVQVQQQQTNSYIPVPLRHPFRSPLPAGAAGTTNAILTPPLGQLNATGLAAKITLKPGNANLTPLGQPYASRFPAKIPPKPGNANLTPLGQFSGPRLPPNFGQQRDFPPPIIADKQNPPVSFELTLVISSQHCLLKWKLPEELPVDNQRVEIMGGDRQNVVQALGREKQFLQKVTAGVQYQASVQSFDIKGRQLALAFKRFRAIYSRNEMEMLRNLAEQFCVPEFYPFDQLHRAKPRAYFDAIYEHPNGRRLMMPYKKDENGHPGSPINGAIDGFFFSTLLSGDSLPTQSPFGDVQMVMDAHKMLNIGAHNFYFADFYCNEAKANVNGISSSLHYVTIVVCRKNSRTDKYCADRLIRLDPTNNKFLRVREERSGLTYLTNNARGLLVEIYYTEPISLFDARKFLEVTPMGKGSSRPEGLPNNKQCRTCNFLV